MLVTCDYFIPSAAVEIIETKLKEISNEYEDIVFLHKIVDESCPFVIRYVAEFNQNSPRIIEIEPNLLPNITTNTPLSESMNIILDNYTLADGHNHAVISAWKWAEAGKKIEFPQNFFLHSDLTRLEIAINDFIEEELKNAFAFQF